MSEQDPYADKKRNEAGGMNDTSSGRTGTQKNTEEDTANAGMEEGEETETEGEETEETQ